MDRPVTVHEMQSMAVGAEGPDFTKEISFMDMGSSNDSLGFDMLANPGKQRSQQNNTFTVAPETQNLGGLAEVEIGSLDTMEPVTLNLGENLSNSAPIEIQFSKAEDEKGGLFSNMQTSTTPGFSLASASAPRMDPVTEKKEKSEILAKLQRLEKKGFPLSKRYTMDNTLEEMNQEFNRQVDARNLEASLRFQRQALMSVVTGLEWANSRFDPFDVKLDGWSEAVHENVEDFDEIFEELYDKYKERGKMPPEARLVMALAGSGFMCHVSNTFLKSRMSNVSADDILKNNPDLAKQFAAAAANQAGPGFGNFMNMAMNGAQPQGAPVGGGAFFGSSAQAASQAAQEAQARARAEVNFQQTVGGTPMSQTPQAVAAMEPRQTARREMRGPTGVDDILQSFAEARRNESMDGSAFPEIPVNPPPATAAAIEIQSMVSGDDIGSTTESRAGRGRRRRQPVGNTLSLAI
ncbi:hypothetical protein EBR66_06750 [bacterium]|nr:hypothetical protein [bacterium]